MTTPLDEQSIERLVRAAVAAVLAELGSQAASATPPGRPVAVLVGSTSAGLDFAVASLGSLGDAGLRLDWLASGKGVDATNRRLGQAVCRDTEAAGCPLEMAASVEAVVVAALDRGLAHRVAATWPDGFGAALVLEALCLGKPVIAATDAMGLDRPDATPQLRAALAEPVGRWEAYGALCVPAAELATALRASVASPAWVAHHDNRPLITAEQVEAAGAELLIGADSIITPLAMDRARELGVKLRRLPA